MLCRPYFPTINSVAAKHDYNDLIRFISRPITVIMAAGDEVCVKHKCL